MGRKATKGVVFLWLSARPRLSVGRAPQKLDRDCATLGSESLRECLLEWRRSIGDTEGELSDRRVVLSECPESAGSDHGLIRALYAEASDCFVFVKDLEGDQSG
jgi:hypothetical protein